MTKEELEKEAEKHADGIYHYKINVLDYGEDGIINYRYSDVKEAYQKGAEFGYNKGYHDAEEHYLNVIDNQHKLVDESKKKDFRKCMKCTDGTYQSGFKYGYNKANEWHYVKDGDLPKETGLLMSKTLNLITKIKGSDCLSLALGQFNFSTQEFDYQHIVGLTDVIAWKEIVLPELKGGE